MPGIMPDPKQRLRISVKKIWASQSTSKVGRRCNHSPKKNIIWSSALIYHISKLRKVQKNAKIHITNHWQKFHIPYSPRHSLNEKKKKEKKKRIKQDKVKENNLTMRTVPSWALIRTEDIKGWTMYVLLQNECQSNLGSELSPLFLPLGLPINRSESHIHLYKIKHRGLGARSSYNMETRVGTCSLLENEA